VPGKPVAEAKADDRRDPLPAGAVARLGSARWRHEGDTRAISFSPDGKTLAVLSGGDGAITLFETATGKVIHRLPSDRKDWHDGPYTIAFSPDCTVLASRVVGGAIELRDARTLKLVRTLMPPEPLQSGGSEDYPI